MVNQGGGADFPRYHRGDSLSASDINALADAIIRRIATGGPLNLTAIGKGLAISLDPRQRGVADAVVPAKVASIVGAGKYTVDVYDAGYDNPVTRQGLEAVTVDPAFTPALQAPISVFFTRFANYIFGSGVGSTLYKVKFNHLDGSYDIHQYDFPNGTAVDSNDITGYELNGSQAVPIGQWVEGTRRGDGNVWFSMPFGC